MLKNKLWLWSWDFDNFSKNNVVYIVFYLCLSKDLKLLNFIEAHVISKMSNFSSFHFWVLCYICYPNLLNISEFGILNLKMTKRHLQFKIRWWDHVNLSDCLVMLITLYFSSHQVQISGRGIIACTGKLLLRLSYYA